MAVNITKANSSDLSVASSITTALKGKIFGDKAYISKDLFSILNSRGLHLFTGIRKDMKNLSIRFRR
ncbi:transposase [Rickettsia amblyommatis]|uniref:Transposase DDE domain protein n=2 Tax=Rickettsia amblyommatis TaxID=33989 RepID=A0A0F3N0G0_RICAM|nr:transposase [Rickettsia amblyommatis]AFC69160.1 transposase [Rickettsia amblyommatis str. GAT-30V]AFC69434.1 transposase [Rickettsia amblyommatis str. GAT-30V]AFC70104.1 transposase [Rickettsia amblyommatis str. GAT-30V]AFC70189.1 transposase [Rickettsia amblyommatis str. GAT-30V]AFC70222.1 transposase [Rickettsia amblyommatis str. GAT-30V]